MDPLATYLAMQRAVQHMRSGAGPAVVEAVTYRFFHQNGAFPGSAFGYRSKEEERLWRDRDPLLQTAGHVVRRGLLTQEQVDAARDRARDLVREAADALLEPVEGGKPGQRRIKPSEWPDPAFADVGVRGDTSEPGGAAVRRPRLVHRRAWPSASLVDVVAEVMGRRMETDDRVVVMGEDVHKPERRHQRRHPRSARPVPRPGARHADQRERLRRARRRHGDRRSLPAGRRVHVRRLHVGRRRPACSTRWRRPGTCSVVTVRCRSCCAARSPWGRGTARSTRWTRQAC
ncbi:hypothetical protein GCM10025868_22550 [Angustibacter aerolatus]|uniref:Dehydrogenase E1 component domain-containing protein n=1 Tax=Angustibacter aerolatus TaxID=1162965 RepID=A0ABQ6JIE7_9ACTN|nr:hypothetical protein GCM10025868_22550 [Angustibacter aerolatus]